MIVMKFGGTSVEDAEAIRNASRIVAQRLNRKPLVVASACAGVTNELVDLAKSACSGTSGRAMEIVEQLRFKHRQIAEELFSGDLRHTIQSQIDALYDVLRDLARSIAILGELTNRSLDTFMSFGEKVSTMLLHHRLVQEGVLSVLVNAQEVIVTNDDFTRALPLVDQIEDRARKILKPKIDAGRVVVTQGFLGATVSGIPTTIGRGGSDYSAALLGAALDAEEIQIWTDVDGVMTCDPSIIKEARLIQELTFHEAAELAYFGARVLHPATILPAIQKNIPVRVLNSKRPEIQGTLILRDVRTPSRFPVKAIAYKRHITLINIESTRMLMMHGFLAKVFEVFAKYEKSVDVIATSEVSLSLTVDSDENLDAIFNELQMIADVQVSHGKAVFCVVGEDLKNARGVITRIFSTLDKHDIGVGLISLGASEINVTFVVGERDVKRTAQALHDEFLRVSRVPTDH